MKRASMIAGGALVGAAAVMVIPQPGKPQQVAVAGNSGSTGQTSGSGATQTNAASGSTSTMSGSTAATAATSVSTVVGALETYQYGQLQVKLTISNGKITHVGFATFVANDGRSIGIDQQAAPILIQETIAAQSAQIQGVSGATYTSGAYDQSLQAAIDKAALK